ncbi:uncharacterized protein PAN0_006d2947 [Moesziomyces antarcticus]|uniref:Uncharacterized protein n=1 Tax=Pseudozyma antarctica TaxID=84753 RepID=A0A081CDI6_PSEA2|nr:uncharacterized protein PAN0_006d2947 [Moesziomyces antarcticus]GAK64732.1 hypothetical protein PAN0_006d2947 [Moesziomyces antarcticus]
MNFPKFPGQSSSSSSSTKQQHTAARVSDLDVQGAAAAQSSLVWPLPTSHGLALGLHCRTRRGPALTFDGWLHFPHLFISSTITNGASFAVHPATLHPERAASGAVAQLAPPDPI